MAKGRSDEPITCTSLTVVDAQGKPVASITSNGDVTCRSAWVTSGGKPGVFLNGKQGLVQCLKFALCGRANNTELVEINGFTGSPTIELRGEGDNAGIRLQAFKGQGGVIDVTDNTGRSGVSMLATDHSSWLTVENSKNGDGKVLIRASYVDQGAGVVYTVDRTGASTARLPPSKDANDSEQATPKKVTKRAKHIDAKRIDQ